MPYNRRLCFIFTFDSFIRLHMINKPCNCLIGLSCVIRVFDTFICALLSFEIPEILYFLRNYREKNINLVHEHAIIYLCLIIGKYPSITTGKISWRWPNYINLSKLGIFSFVAWGIIVCYTDLNIQHTKKKFRFLDFVMNLLNTHVIILFQNFYLLSIVNDRQILF